MIALAGLGKVVVKALGGEEVTYPAGSRIVLPYPNMGVNVEPTTALMRLPPGSRLVMPDGREFPVNERFDVRCNGMATAPLPIVRVIPGSSWGFFTIACTIPIALFVGLWMNKFRPGHAVEASLIGGALTLGATVLGGVVSQSSYAHWFNLSAGGVTGSMAAYGFVAAVLPVWLLLVPRDYLSSFLKIGTIAALVLGVLVANPKLEAPAFNPVFAAGGPTVRGSIVPFLFITILCGAISGFHALISSGTTSKMLANERDARTIGYGAMLFRAQLALTGWSPANAKLFNAGLQATLNVAMSSCVLVVIAAAAWRCLTARRENGPQGNTTILTPG